MIKKLEENIKIEDNEAKVENQVWVTYQNKDIVAPDSYYKLLDDVKGAEKGDLILVNEGIIIEIIKLDSPKYKKLTESVIMDHARVKMIRNTIKASVVTMAEKPIWKKKVVK